MAEVDEGVPEQQTTVVAQLEAELANAEAYGNTVRAEEIEAQLEALGVKKSKKDDKSPSEKRAESGKKQDEAPTQRHQASQQHTKE